MNNPRRILPLIPLLGVIVLGFYGVSLLATASRNQSCQSNLKRIGLGLSQYQRDYDEKNVMANNWKAALQPYTKAPQIFDCPSRENNYALNRYSSGTSFGQLQKNRDFTETPTVFDSTSNQPSAADFGTSYPEKGAHPFWRRGRGTNVLFFDMHVEWRQQKPDFEAIKLLPTPLPPIIIHESPVKRDAWGRIIVKIEPSKPR
jgi:hypothetical protein